MLGNKIQKLDMSLMINYLLMGYAFIIPLSRAGIVLFSLLLIIFWFVEGGLKEKYHLVRKNKVILALLIFIVFNFISLLWSDHMLEGLGYIKKYWYFFPLVVLFTSAKKEYISKILSAFILGMLVSEVISYGVFFELWEFKHATPANPTPFMGHIEYSVFLALTALVLLSRVFTLNSIKHKVLYGFFFISISGNLFLIGGRTGQFAFIVGLFVFFILHFKNKMKAVVGFMLLSTLILWVGFYLSITFQTRVLKGKQDIVEVIEKQNYCTSWGSRVGAWIVSKDIIIEDPLLGLGLIDNMQKFHMLIDTQYLEMKCMHKPFMHVHNQYLQVFIGLGLVGLLLFLNIFYQLGRIVLKEREYKNIQYVYIGILSFAFIPEVLLHRQFSLALFTLIVGLILAQHRSEHEI